jgi:hypothetical protein|tara:strand:+ start:233 stop:418 length:186 start_codon:yes stop_codon:yes gene_type:complete
MAKNLWDIERKTLFISVLRDYQDEGYDKEEAKKLAKKDVDDIMNEKISFVSNIWDDTYEED